MELIRISFFILVLFIYPRASFIFRMSASLVVIASFLDKFNCISIFVVGFQTVLVFFSVYLSLFIVGFIKIHD